MSRKPGSTKKPRGKPFGRGAANPKSKDYRGPIPDLPPPESPLVGDQGTERALALIERLLAGDLSAKERDNLLRRRRLLARCLKSNRLRQAVLRKCRADIIWFINLFVFQFNPKKRKERVGPFLTWDFQERALLDTPEKTGTKGILWCYENDRTCVVEKSREMGASWLFLIFQDWLCLLFDHSQVLDISKSADAVDDKSPNSLFWKIRFMHRYMPDWLTGPVTAQSMFFGYERTDSYITGEASTARAGVGGRAAVIFVDEFSKIREDREIREYTANTSDCRFFNGTHQGVGTEFYKLTEEDSVVKLRMHWSQHPAKNEGLYSYENRKLKFWEYVPHKGLVELRAPKYDYGPDYEFVMDGTPTGGPFPGLRSPWYDRKCKDIGTSRGVSMELDIDPKGSVSQPFEPLLIHTLKQMAREPDWEGELEHDEDGEPIRLLKVAGGPIKLWCPLINGWPVPDLYAAGADVAAGAGNSPSCLGVANARTGQKVMQYSNAHIRPDRFAALAAAVCRMFKSPEGPGAMICWEHTGGPGVNFGNTLMQECGYRNVWMNRREGEPGKGRYVSAVGFKPTGAAKNVLLTDYLLALTNREYHNLSAEALDECLAFRYSGTGVMIHGKDQGKDPESARENHGDLVMMDAITWKVVKHLGQLASRQKPDEPPTPAEDNIFTVAGRRAMHERQRAEDTWE